MPLIVTINLHDHPPIEYKYGESEEYVPRVNDGVFIINKVAKDGSEIFDIYPLTSVLCVTTKEIS